MLEFIKTFFMGEEEPEELENLSPAQIRKLERAEKRADEISKKITYAVCAFAVIFMIIHIIIAVANNAFAI